MLLIGSRAIVHHFPDFRRPRDWDLIGTDEDIERLGRILPRHKGGAGEKKAHFKRGSTLIEVANASVVPYWARVLETFADEPTLTDPELGTLAVAPPAYLLLTKQCGLIYRIMHWHKNLEDLYWLRERVPTMPDHIAALLPEALADSRRMFLEGHQVKLDVPGTCHPSAAGPTDPSLHQQLHRRLAIGPAPVVESASAWDGFPSLTGQAKREAMIRLFAEEALVNAATEYLRSIASIASEDPEVLARWALRTLITGDLPEGWRYFGVNYYREIRSLIPGDWMDRLGDLRDQRVVYEHPCADGTRACDGVPVGERIVAPGLFPHPTS